MAERLSALRAGRPLTPGRFLVLTSVPRPSSTAGHSAAGMIMSIEKSNDLIGNRTRYLPACSTVPQPTTLPRARWMIAFICNTRHAFELRHIGMFCEIRVESRRGYVPPYDLQITPDVSAMHTGSLTVFWSLTPWNLPSGYRIRINILGSPSAHPEDGCIFLRWQW
jgi:hypothetical protein